MGKYMSLVIGGVVALVGLMGLIRWHAALVIVLKGSVPILFILGGAIAVIAGISEIKDEAAAQKEEKK